MSKQYPTQPSEQPLKVPFAMQIVDNPRVNGVLIGLDAMKKAGVQSEFVAANMMQAAAMDCAIILRSGDPPQYDKKRSSKSGLNLSKTSNQGFFKGALSVEERFARLSTHGFPLPHHEYDRKNLNESLTSIKYQHRMQLDVTMQDVLKEIGPDGDLSVLGLDKEFLRLGYKDNYGPPKSQFNGQFVINLNQGIDNPQFLSRAWNHPENDSNWDPERKIIKKPDELRDVPDDIYQKVFFQTFNVGYMEEKGLIFNPEHIKKAEVFANRPRTVEQFLIAIGESHPYYELVKECYSLENLLNTLKTKLSLSSATAIISEVYSKNGRIVAGDWDGIALGHPPALDLRFTEVINVFEPMKASENQTKLLVLSEEYLLELKKAAQLKIKNRITLSAFENKILSIKYFTDIVNKFALERAGCITPHEFLFQQVLNHAYRDEANTHYGERYNMELVQKSMSALISSNPSDEESHHFTKHTLKRDMDEAKETISEVMLDKLADHMVRHLKLARQTNASDYKLPHLQYDINVHDLYQHGFDMRNPYGCNLAGPWLLIVDGGVLYGDTQEQLIEVLLTGDFLQKNRIDINYRADFSVGWNKVIERQMMLGQNIPEKTLEHYSRYKAQIQQEAPRANDSSNSSIISSNEARIAQQLDIKRQLAAKRGSVIDEHQELVSFTRTRI